MGLGFLQTTPQNSTLTGRIGQLNESFFDNTTYLTEDGLVEALSSVLPEESSDGEDAEPNTALLSAILMFGTFFIAYFLRVFRNGKYLGRTIRRALGDFGVPLAILIMVLLDYSVNDIFTEKLQVPSGLQEP